MPTLKKTTLNADTLTSPDLRINNDQTQKISLYEQSREERIKENMQKMKNLGLKDISLTLRSIDRPNKRQRNPALAHKAAPVIPYGPQRRSSRLQNATPVSYSEYVALNDDQDPKLEMGSKPEVYTEDHEKLLGNTEMSWTLFVDGFGKDGRRIYDPVKGKTCHQCRQKTLGLRTHCSQCNLVQGQFCGDCLYMRYGEHVVEAIENPNWICPACRGICNCSLCRQAKGWPATGSLYRKISNLGFKSVAHYLIQTQRSQNNVEKDSGSLNQVSAKRSLPFSDMETLSTESPAVNNDQLGSLKTKADEKREGESKNEESMQSGPYLATDDQSLADSHQILKRKRALSFEPECIAGQQRQTSMDHDIASSGMKENILNVEQGVDNTSSVMALVQEKEMLIVDNQHDGSNIAIEICPKLEKPSYTTEPNPNSIAGKLGQHSVNNGGCDEESRGRYKQLDVDKGSNGTLSDQELKKENKTCFVEHSKVVLDPKLKKKPARVSKLGTDGIAERLKQRHRLSKGLDEEVPPTMNDKASVMRLATNNISSGKADIDLDANPVKTSPDDFIRRLRPRIKTT
ncbi:hypothetical protein HS088_TW01G00848 [Tripterygium wilfordii]|uniref:Zinc-finger domain-containing protein n=1 Tax=Tripterygium wilfordii TaxID=458696 RepID=A0A7J7E2R3_TRIWF|nr:uncharacterized protein LOC119987497 [Tripterygium wilfordii]KAF5752930.1 hypothetical protein HS088_TW01G00848 [Tripterygium wilfordii]